MRSASPHQLERRARADETDGIAETDEARTERERHQVAGIAGEQFLSRRHVCGGRVRRWTYTMPRGETAVCIYLDSKNHCGVSITDWLRGTNSRRTVYNDQRVEGGPSGWRGSATTCVSPSRAVLVGSRGGKWGKIQGKTVGQFHHPWPLVGVEWPCQRRPRRGLVQLCQGWISKAVVDGLTAWYVHVLSQLAVQ